MFLVLEMFSATVSPMLVMFLCILVGFILRKTKILPENASTVLSKLGVFVLLPARIVYSMITNCTVESIMSQYRVVLYGTLATGISVLIAVFLSRFFSKERDERAIYQYSLFTANYGYLGNAIVADIMGEQALYSYIFYTVPLSIAVYSWGFQTLIPEGKGPKKSLLVRLAKPPLIATVVGIALGLFGAGKWMPGFALTAVKNLANCMGPVSMILTGFVIGGYHIPSLLTNKKVYIATLLRVAVLPLTLVAALWVCGADKTILLLTMFMSGSALGLNTVVAPAAYGGDTHTGASMAMISHVCCIVSIPLLYALLNYIL